MNLKLLLSMIYYGCLHILHNTLQIKKGQDVRFEILQTSHRLEKGLCIREQRKDWGFEKAETLVSLLSIEASNPNRDQMAFDIGAAVLAAFIEEKKKASEEKPNLDKLLKKISTNKLKIQYNPQIGGSIQLHLRDVYQDESVKRLFYTRHSVRDFSPIPVEKERIEKAVELALRSPSACNRQATQIYVISGEERKNLGGGNDYFADKYLIITGNMKAFSLQELNDWIVSTSVFCGYLSLALHAENIGSCIYRKEIISKSKYNDSLREYCHIPDDEQIILEMAIGNYKEEFNVPVSRRREAREIIHFTK